MKIDPSLIQTDEVGKFAYINWDKKYLTPKKRKLDINEDSRVWSYLDWDLSNKDKYIAPADTTPTVAPKELPWRDPFYWSGVKTYQPKNNNTWFWYKPKPNNAISEVPPAVQTSEVVKPNDAIKPSVDTTDYSKQFTPNIDYSKQISIDAVAAATSAATSNVPKVNNNSLQKDIELQNEYFRLAEEKRRNDKESNKLQLKQDISRQNEYFDLAAKKREEQRRNILQQRISSLRN